MNSKTLRCVALALISVQGYLVSPAVNAQHASVTLERDATDSNVVAQFTLSTPVTKLRFYGDGQVRTQTWRPSSGKLSSDGMALEFLKPTSVFSVKLLPFERDGQIDRVYSPVIPFSDGDAIAVYSEYLLPKGGGDVAFAVSGVSQGTFFRSGEKAWRANDAATYLLLTERRPMTQADLKFSLDAKIPSWLRAQVTERSIQIYRYYSERFGTAPPTGPWILASIDEKSLAGANFRGDTRPSLIRLNFLGPSWSIPSEAKRKTVDAFVAHEMSHIWNAELAKPSESAPVWLFEGGADALATEALFSVGAIDETEYRSLIATSLIGCSSAKGNRLTEKIKSKPRAAYECGQGIFHLYAKWANERSSTPFAALWSRVFEGENRTYGIATVFPQLLSENQSIPIKELKAFLDGSGDWDSLLSRAVATNVVRHPSGNDLLSPIAAPFVVDAAVLSAIKSDCGGAISVAYDNLSYTIFPLPTCKSISTPLVATHLGGVEMRAEPVRAASYAQSRCLAGEYLELSTSDPSASIRLSCASRAIKPANVVIPN